jgi:hypothetical protein
MIRHATGPLLTILFAAASWGARAMGQTTAVAGTGDPGVDVPAIQAAVDRGGHVILTGHFSFDIPPVIPGGAVYGRTVTISKAVEISGSGDDREQMPVIAGGFFPFFIEAADSQVAIRGLRFVHPKGGAIWSYAVNGLTIAECRFDGIEPSVLFAGYAGIRHPLAGAILIGSNPAPPKRGQEALPENNSGTLAIVNNQIEVGGSVGDQTVGICIFGVGKSPSQIADVQIAGNQIRNITERAMSISQIGGRIRIERNAITTGSISGPSNGIQPDVIHVAGSGFYSVTRNVIVSQWAAGAGIRVQGSTWSPQAGSVVADNDVTMSAPEGILFGANSAAIEIRGQASNNSVHNNRIRGRARAALAVVAYREGIPRNNKLARNDLAGFEASLRPVLVTTGIANEPAN